MDGLKTMLRVARRGTKITLDDGEDEVVRSLLLTVLLGVERA